MSMDKIREVTLIDYGAGNLLSVKRAFENFNAKVVISSNADQILSSSRVVLPGVGAFKSAMHSLVDHGLDKVLKEVAKQKIPLLGICLGMQLLLDESNEHGSNPGLGLIPGHVEGVPNQSQKGEKLRIPHVGWNEIYPHKEDSWKNTLLKNNHPGEAVYFLHSYKATVKKQEHIIAYCLYGGNKITAAIKLDHIFGCQFHPEKSGLVGLKIMQNFLAE